MMRVAVVGGGQIAGKVYLPVLAAMDDVELTALVEPDERRREVLDRTYRFGAALASVEDLSGGQVDAAVLLTPHDTRRGPLTRLMELGVDVLSEKPMAESLGQAEQFVRLAEDSGRILMIGFNRRFMPACGPTASTCWTCCGCSAASPFTSRPRAIARTPTGKWPSGR